MSHIPSLKTLRDVFGQSFRHDYGEDLAEKNLKELREALVLWREHRLSSKHMMQLANMFLKGHGIEYLESENERAKAYYVNTGDTYNATLLLDIPRNRVWATTWGDWVEAEERRGNKFA
jgi:hypothetical protein